ncbi:ParM/StbA family protein [Clostridium saudiense]|jgi:plasmid segregation protein ParM|uniref:ParM/StbA family protein n=1 Tax=Clostridium saudiense TaxID=1414720 RepID=UPI0026738197|nr:ParM/StbA family protein [Clostridium saudiense]
MKEVIIDIGNHNFKFDGDVQGLFSSKYSIAFEPNPEAFERIEIDGVVTFIGVGELEREYNKADKNIIPQVLYAISKSTKDSDINLCLLVPINQLPQREKIIYKFNNKSFKCVVNGQARTIKINKCVVLPEGQVSYYSLTNPSPYQLIIDIGSKTVNWCCYQEGKMFKNGTEKLGTYDLYNTIMKFENSKGEDYIAEDIEGQIKRGRIIVDESVYKDFLKDILNRIKANINIKNYDACFTGGGSLILESIIKKIPKVQLHQYPLYSNVLGAKSICRKAWK